MKKYNDLIKEQNLLKEEHKCNVKDLNTKIDELEIQIKFKNDKIADLEKQFTGKEQELSKQRLDIEKLMKNLKDMALIHSMG